MEEKLERETGWRANLVTLGGEMNSRRACPFPISERTSEQIDERALAVRSYVMERVKADSMG